MRTRIVASLATCAGLAALLLGCGVESSESACERVATDLVDAVRENAGGSPLAVSIATPDAEYWCDIEVATGASLARGGSVRVAVMQESERTLNDWSFCGVRVTLSYEDEPDIIETGACPPAGETTSPARR